MTLVNESRVEMLSSSWASASLTLNFNSLLRSLLCLGLHLSHSHAFKGISATAHLGERILSTERILLLPLLWAGATAAL